MATSRRMGPKGSEIWHSMLDAAEEILRDEGYGALASRRVAERVGVKQRLVYYYFRTMDELIVETFRRLALRERERLVKALDSRHSLREIWEVCVDTQDTRMVSEFMALANRSEPFRKEVRDYIESTRNLHVTVLTQAMKDSGVELGISPEAASIFATSAALALHREAEIGITNGHADVMDAINRFISRFDPDE